MTTVPSRPVWGWLALLAMAVIALGDRAIPPAANSLTDAAALRPLFAALAKEATRPFEGRLSGFPYAPAPPIDGGPPRATVDVRIAAATLERRVRQPDDASAQMLLATLSLALRDGDRAVPPLEASTSAAPANARAWNDLAAVLLWRGRRDQNVEDLARALDAAERAWRLEPSHAEAGFNRALALESLYLSTAAVAAWNDYLALDRGSPWQQEARGHLSALAAMARADDPASARNTLGEAIVSGDRETLRAYAKQTPSLVRLALRQTLDAWTAACAQERRCDDLEPLLQGSALATLLAEVTADRLEPDWFAAFVSAPHVPARQRLASAYQRLLEGRARYDAFEYEEAGQRFAEAMHAIPTPLIDESRLERAAVFYQRRNFAAARPLLDAVIDRENRHGYARLIGRAEVIGGNMDVNIGEFTSALRRYTRSMDAFLAAGDLDGVVNAKASAAQTLTMLGQTRESWRQYGEALGSLSRVRTPRVRRALLDAAGLSAAAAGLNETARRFGEACAAAADLDGVAGAAAEAQLRLSRIYWRLGDRPRAERALARAREWNLKAGRISADFNEARLAAIEGEILSASAPASAVTKLDRAVEYYEHNQRRSNLPEALLARGRARYKAGDVDRAAADFEYGLREIDALTNRVDQPRLRTSYVDTLFDLVDALVRLEIENRHQTDAAFAIAERWRGRTLWLKRDRETPRTPEARSLQPDAIARSLPPRTALLFYYALPDRLVTWAMTPRGATFRTIDVGADALSMQARRLNERIQTGDDATAAAGRLYDWLLRPHDAELGEVDTVFVLPDARLAGIPFAGLRDAAANTYAIESRSFAVVPSLRLFVRSRETGGAPEKAMVMGVERATDVTGRELSALPSVDREVEHVARIYNGSTVLTGDAATRSAFVRALATHDVVHFAGHAIANHQEPALSRLLVAAENGAPGAVFPGDVACTGPCRARLVVLASCESAGGQASRSEGTVSLATSFLAAGVDATVATLWPVDDRSASELFVELHRQIAERRPVEQALRSVQMRALRSGQVPMRDWAGLEVITGRRIDW